jgi:hypothetical protein
VVRRFQIQTRLVSRRLQHRQQENIMATASAEAAVVAVETNDIEKRLAVANENLADDDKRLKCLVVRLSSTLTVILYSLKADIQICCSTPRAATQFSRFPIYRRCSFHGDLLG